MKVFAHRLTGDYADHMGEDMFVVPLEYADYDDLPHYLTDGEKFYSKGYTDPYNLENYAYSRNYALKVGYATYGVCSASCDNAPAATMVVDGEFEGVSFDTSLLDAHRGSDVWKNG